VQPAVTSTEAKDLRMGAFYGIVTYTWKELLVHEGFIGVYVKIVTQLEAVSGD